MKLKEVAWYGLDPEKVKKEFPNDPTFLRDFEVRGNVWSVFYVKNPNVELGHKNYLMLGKDPMTRQWFVSGCTVEQMDKERFQSAVLCTQCDTILYSIARHHYHTCDCPNQTMVDGGKDYLRYGGMNMSKIMLVNLDLVTGEIVGKPKKARSLPSEKPKAEKKPASKKAKRSQRSEK